MPLIRYSQYIAYPDGSPAAEIEVPVLLLGGNQLVPLFTSKAGTTPVSNPVTTDQDGLVSVYAAPGTLAVELAGQFFHFPVDPEETDPAWPGTFIHTQASASTQWTVAHHFGVQPSVTVLVSGVVTTPSSVSHTDDETTVITFGSSTSGTAYLRR
jgi:hypothetical protein